MLSPGVSTILAGWLRSFRALFSSGNAGKAITVASDGTPTVTDVQPQAAILTSLNGIWTGLVVKRGSAAVEGCGLASTDGQLTIAAPRGDTGDPTFTVNPGFLTAGFFRVWLTTDGVGLIDNLTSNYAYGATYSAFGTDYLPLATITATSSTQIYRIATGSAIFCLAQHCTYRWSIVTGSTLTSLRYRIGLTTSAGIGTSLVPTGGMVAVVFDTDSGQANAATHWYLLTYDGSSGAGTYTRLGQTCQANTAYEIELFYYPGATISVRIRAAGGTWTNRLDTSSSNVPASTTALYAQAILTLTASGITRTLGFRSFSAHKEYGT